MTTAPTPAAPGALGPLQAADEEALAAAYPELRERSLTLGWAADRLGLQPARLAALVRSGGVLTVPGPWCVRQAHGRLGALVPAWQFAAGMRLRPGLPALVAAAAAAGWTSLQLDRFMTTRASGGRTPAELLAESGPEPVLALIAGRRLPAAEAPARPDERRRRRLLQRSRARRAALGR